MPNVHANPGLTTRPPRDVRDAAKDTLGDHGWEVEAFIHACLNALNANPARFLAIVAPHRPPPRPRGRPRRTDQP